MFNTERRTQEYSFGKANDFRDDRKIVTGFAAIGRRTVGDKDSLVLDWWWRRADHQQLVERRRIGISATKRSPNGINRGTT